MVTLHASPAIFFDHHPSAIANQPLTVGYHWRFILLPHTWEDVDVAVVHECSLCVHLDVVQNLLLVTVVYCFHVLSCLREEGQNLCAFTREHPPHSNSGFNLSVYFNNVVINSVS